MGYVHLINGSGSGFGSFYFIIDFKDAKKTNLEKKVDKYSILQVLFHHFSTIKVLKKDTNQQK